MVANTGTYLDSPFHRYADGNDLSAMPLRSLAGLEAVVIHGGTTGRAIDRAAFAGRPIGGKAVLVRRGWYAHWRTRPTSKGTPILTADAAAYLVAEGAALVGIDSVNIDDISDLAGRCTRRCSRPRSRSSSTCAARPAARCRFPVLSGPSEVAGFGTFPRSRLRHALTRPPAVPFRQTTVAGFPALALRSEEIEVVAVPVIGMKLTHLRRLRGREWLWRSDQIPLTVPGPGASYTETAGSGGWDECFPTVSSSPIPGAPVDTASLPDGGELWSADWTSAVYERATAPRLPGRRGVRGCRTTSTAR